MTGEHGIWGLDYQLHPSQGGKAKLTPGRQRPINYVKAPDVTCLTFYFANKRWGGGSKKELPTQSHHKLLGKLGKDLGGLVRGLGILPEPFRFYGLSPRDSILVPAI